jgi:tetratricopeptide (TPR) repeat protein
MNDEPAAISEFKTAIKMDSDNTEANLNLGYVALNSGDFDLAFSSFEAALKGAPGNTDAKMGMAVALRGRKEYDKSAKLYEEILSADPGNERAYYNAATLYEKYTKDYKKASKVLQAYVDTNNKGQMGPDHEVYARMDRVKESERIEEERKRVEEQKRKEAEDRKKRQQETFEQLKGKVAELKKIMDTYGSCPAMVESGAIDAGTMVLEQAVAVVEAEEFDMAGDIMTFVDEALPQIQAVIPSCASGAPAPAPAAPAEGAAPAAPAEGAAPAAPAAPAEGAAPSGG